jgi:hypothetical protein
VVLFYPNGRASLLLESKLGTKTGKPMNCIICEGQGDAMEKWHDITTAPFDKPILLYFQDLTVITPQYRIGVGTKIRNYWFGWPVIRRITPTEPTHWQPLPKPPQTEVPKGHEPDPRMCRNKF